MNKLQILQETSFGQRIAEDETELETYFVETDQWKRLWNGNVDIVYGPKGSGKSALYSLLISKSQELHDKRILLVIAENLRGTPVFQNLVVDPPASENEFIGLWKLFFTALLHSTIVDNGISNKEATELGTVLAEEGLIKGTRTLASLFKSVTDYMKKIRIEKFDFGPEVNEAGLLSGFKGGIIFSEPNSAEIKQGIFSVDHLLNLANIALSRSNLSAWVLLDRLDVAFSENEDLEVNALRALFRVYLDMQALQSIKLKIFLRSDIWNRITSQGFREASHITKTLTISWESTTLLNLIVKRAIHNKPIQIAFAVSEDLPQQSIHEQENFFYRVFPPKVDAAANKPTTLDWMLSRTRDGSKYNAPRELIHFLNGLRDAQVKRLEVGETEPEGEQLFGRSAFKDALSEVSNSRLHQTLYAEFPKHREWLEKLRGARTLQSPATLSEIWNISEAEAIKEANELVAIGFFEARGTRTAPEYWVPFLYRDSLDMVQGTAE